MYVVGTREYIVVFFGHENARMSRIQGQYLTFCPEHLQKFTSDNSRT